MTGAFLRVEREGQWDKIEVENLTPVELDEIIGSRSNAEIMDWLSVTCSTLRLADVSFIAMEKKEETMREAMQEFVDRVDKGEVHSSYTYKKFKDILS